MLATEILKGQGIGNQLFCYVTTRSIAFDRGLEFGIKDSGWIGDKRYNQNGFYWMNLDLGYSVPDNMQIYYERDKRIKLETCWHDMTHGCDIRKYDSDLVNVSDNTIIFGNMQDPKYFFHNKDLVKEWLKVKPEYDTYQYTDNNVCILNFRGGEYVGFSELYLTRKYWIDAMNNMSEINPNMEFVVITDDIKASQDMLPEIPAYHFSVDKDYAIIKNAKHVILSNSSFPFFAVFTSNTIENVIAPKYWSRHNVSDGYWASGQNLYSGWNYQDVEGNLQTYDECLIEFQKYSERNNLYV
jgi:hypothetical protein